MEKTIKIECVFLAVDADGTEKLFNSSDGVERMAEYDTSYDGPNYIPFRVGRKTYWGRPSIDGSEDYSAYIKLPRGSIKKLIGRDMTWEDGLYMYSG